MIVYYKHNQIDYTLWDKTITLSQNGLVYAMSWYLDIVSPGWEALIEGEYEYVMPLPVKQRLGIPYLSQPYFTQQLGIYGTSQISPEKVQLFISKIPWKFLRRNINLNTLNPLTISSTITHGVNYDLNLDKTYDNLYSGYNENTKRNIKKAKNQHLSLTNIEIKLFIEKCKLEKPTVPNSVFNIMGLLLERAQKEKACKIIVVENQQKEIIAGTAFIKTLNRIIYLVSFSFDEGKEKAAMFLLVDAVVKEYCSTNLILDFEGSSIPGTARFFAGFGASKQLYPVIRKKI
jgi:hypothetical protein